MDIDAVLREKGGIQLDIGCGQSKQSPAWVGMDVRPFDGVDIIHDWNDTPWPMPDECVTQAIASHVVEHIPPVYWRDGKTVFGFLDFMNEAWRVMQPDGRFAVACPYGWSAGMLQDPTHVNFVNENTWLYFDPIAQGGALYRFYRPKPWKIDNIFWDPSGNLEVLLIKRREDRSYMNKYFYKIVCPKHREHNREYEVIASADGTIPVPEMLCPMCTPSIIVVPVRSQAGDPDDPPLVA